MRAIIINMKQTCLTALVAASAIFLSNPVNTQSVSSLPGALEASLSVTSINNIAGLMAGVLPQFIANNKTIEIGYNTSTWTYSVDLHDIHLQNLVINTCKIDFVPNGNGTIRAFLSGINLASNINGTITVGLVTVHGAALNITNLTVSVDLLAVPVENDTVKW